MNLKKFAALLNGREYQSEITKAEEIMAKELGYVVVYGASDDLAEFVGAIRDEVGCYVYERSKYVYIDESGIFSECDCDCKYSQCAKEKCKIIKIIKNKNGEPTFEYKTDIPHETFEIMEDGDLYCRGIVFDIKSLSAMPE